MSNEELLKLDLAEITNILSYEREGYTTEELKKLEEREASWYDKMMKINMGLVIMTVE